MQDLSDTFRLGGYQLIYADPPWQYKDPCHSGNRGASYKYELMGIEAIKALPVKLIAADNCLLAMWWVPPMPQEALEVIDAWGFKLINMKGFTWVKRTKNWKLHWGMGSMTRANSEDCLFARLGKPKPIARNVHQIIEAQVREHSQKPDEARNLLTQLMGDVPRIELFARQQCEGWVSWGLEVPGR